ncbi:MAG: S8 family serine peptidase [Prevotella sp.]|jgi:subtilisin family serine protease|nr:S8 family serine peptidase [Prevotella sp.]
MKGNQLFIILCLCLPAVLGTAAAAQNDIPQKTVTVAVIDDGFRLTHKAIKNNLFVNKNEMPDNLADDDNNGYIDDVQGYDISDDDNNAALAADDVEINYHGTYIASIIVKEFVDFFGEAYRDYIQIIPVKILNDNSKSKYYLDGYKGIKYACSLKPDIVCMAWSGGEIPADVAALIRQHAGTIFVASAGNGYSDKLFPPAAEPSVVSVAALDTNLLKLKESNYSQFMDFCEIGQHVKGAYINADNAFTFIDGTSSATAKVAGYFAIAKSLNIKNIRKLRLEEQNLAIKAAFIQTADNAMDALNPKYSGKLGYGKIVLSDALQYLRKQKFNVKGKLAQIPYRTKSPIYIPVAYCSKNTFLRDSAGVVEDGSGDSLNYANEQDCRWVIEAPEGKRIKITFTKLDTEPDIDVVYIFEGDNTMQSNMLAKFSGKELPPTIVSFGNKVLIWFITNDSATFSGWRFEYTQTDETAGVYESP